MECVLNEQFALFRTLQNNVILDTFFRMSRSLNFNWVEKYNS
jgi:hypothetical protein